MREPANNLVSLRGGGGPRRLLAMSSILLSLSQSIGIFQTALNSTSAYWYPPGVVAFTRIR